MGIENGSNFRKEVESRHGGREVDMKCQIENCTLSVTSCHNAESGGRKLKGSQRRGKVGLQPLTFHSFASLEFKTDLANSSTVGPVKDQYFNQALNSHNLI